METRRDNKTSAARQIILHRQRDRRNAWHLTGPATQQTQRGPW